LAAAQAVRPEELVELIVREGPRAVAIRTEPDIARGEQSARLVWPNPSVVYSREGAGFAEFLQAEQALPIFGVRSALARAGIAAVEAAEAERDARLWALRAEAAAAVARLSAAQAGVDAAVVVASQVEALSGMMRVREREGEGSRFDRLRVETELAGVRQAVADAKADLAAARGALAAMLPAGAAVPVAGELSPGVEPLPSDAELASRAAASRAELRALRHAIARGREEASAAVRQRLPQPIVTAGMKRADTGGGRDIGGSFGVGVSVPLFDTGRRGAARWQAEQRRAEALRAAVEQRIRGEVAAAADTVRARDEALRSAPPAHGADDLVAMADLAYREGEIGIVALLDALRAAGDARTRAIALRLNARLARIELERAVGDVLWP
jgi:cobalt-zinc-cadmium efflux system outer membrane protein